MPAQADITSVQNPRVKALVKLRDQRGRRLSGRFIAEGRREVERAIAAGLVVESIWVCRALLGDVEGLIRAFAMFRPGFGGDRSVEVVSVSEQVFRKIAYVRDPEGVLAVCEPPRWTVESLPAVDQQLLDLVAVGTEKPGNLGAMVRTAALAGCRCVIAAGTPVDALNPNAIRASTGAVFTLPTVTLGEDEAIDYLIANKVRVMSAMVDGAVDHAEADFTGPCAIVIGPEDRGLSEPWRAAAEKTGGAAVRIRTRGGSADSLNASVAAGVLLFEAARQRRAGGLQ